jgi:hypothetical protein
MSICELAADFAICSAPPMPARKAPRNSVPVNSSAWLTPSAAVLAILGRGSDQNAEARFLHQQIQQAEHHGASDDQKNLVGWEHAAKDRHGMAQRRRPWSHDFEWPPDFDHQILDDQHDPEGREELQQLRHMVNSSQEQDFDCDTNQADHDAADQQCQDEHRQ